MPSHFGRDTPSFSGAGWPFVVGMVRGCGRGDTQLRSATKLQAALRGIGILHTA